MERLLTNRQVPFFRIFFGMPATYLRLVNKSAGNSGSSAQVTISRSPSRTTLTTVADFCTPSPSIPGQNDPLLNSGNRLMAITTLLSNLAGPQGSATAPCDAELHIRQTKKFTCVELDTQRCASCIPTRGDPTGTSTCQGSHSSCGFAL